MWCDMSRASSSSEEDTEAAQFALPAFPSFLQWSVWYSASMQPGKRECVAFTCFHSTLEQNLSNMKHPCILIHIKLYLIGRRPITNFYKRLEKLIEIQPFSFWFTTGGKICATWERCKPDLFLCLVDNFMWEVNFDCTRFNIGKTTGRLFNKTKTMSVSLPKNISHNLSCDWGQPQITESLSVPRRSVSEQAERKVCIYSLGSH